MKPPKYDRKLLSTSDEELNDYIDESGKCIVLDWRGDECDMVDELAEMLPDGLLSHEWVDAENDVYLIFRGRRHKVGLTLSGRDRYIMLRRLNEVMAGEYELRAFRHMLGGDTHCFYPARCDWWAAMEAAFPEEVARVFALITPDMDFPDSDYRESARPDGT